MERSEAYMAKIAVDAIDREIHLDAVIQIRRDGRKLRAWCVSTNTWTQFPTTLRKEGARYVADVVKMGSATAPFYRAYKGSIRSNVNSPVLG